MDVGVEEGDRRRGSIWVYMKAGSAQRARHVACAEGIKGDGSQERHCGRRYGQRAGERGKDHAHFERRKPVSTPHPRWLVGMK